MTSMLCATNLPGARFQRAKEWQKDYDARFNIKESSNSNAQCAVTSFLSAYIDLCKTNDCARAFPNLRQVGRELTCFRTLKAL